jgi:hypothetical protein
VDQVFSGGVIKEGTPMGDSTEIAIMGDSTVVATVNISLK